MSEEATYEEYLKAKEFARWKYKYGLFVLIACWIGIVVLIIYVAMYGNELATNPAAYFINKMDIKECYCYGEGVQYYINSTTTMFLEDLKIPNTITP